jgi:colicin import membrane protein
LCMLVLCLALGAATVRAAQGSAEIEQAARRAQLTQERKSLERRYAEDAALCRERFAATACVDEARQRQRNALVPLREEQLRIDESQRQARAQAKREVLAARQQRAAAAALASTPQQAHAAGAQAGANTAANLAASTTTKPAANSATAVQGSAPMNQPASGQSAARQGERASKRARAEAAASAAAGVPQKAARSPRQIKSNKGESAEQQQDRAQKARASAQRRAGAASATQERIAARQAARAKAGRPTDPLPVPGSAPVQSTAVPTRPVR